MIAKLLEVLLKKDTIEAATKFAETVIARNGWDAGIVNFKMKIKLIEREKFSHFCSTVCKIANHKGFSSNRVLAFSHSLTELVANALTHGVKADGLAALRVQISDSYLAIEISNDKRIPIPHLVLEVFHSPQESIENIKGRGLMLISDEIDELILTNPTTIKAILNKEDVNYKVSIHKSGNRRFCIVNISHGVNSPRLIRKIRSLIAETKISNQDFFLINFKGWEKAGGEPNIDQLNFDFPNSDESSIAQIDELIGNYAENEINQSYSSDVGRFGDSWAINNLIDVLDDEIVTRDRPEEINQNRIQSKNSSSISESFADDLDELFAKAIVQHQSQYSKDHVRRFNRTIDISKRIHNESNGGRLLQGGTAIFTSSKKIETYYSNKINVFTNKFELFVAAIEFFNQRKFYGSDYRSMENEAIVSVWKEIFEKNSALY